MECFVQNKGQNGREKEKPDEKERIAANRTNVLNCGYTFYEEFSITYSDRNGITLLVIAFLVSPVGIPMAAAWLLGKVQAVRYAIQDWVY